MKSLKPLYPYIRRHQWSIVAGIVFVFAANTLSPVIPVIVGQAVNLAEHQRIDTKGLFTFAVLAVCISAIAACFLFLMRRVLIDISRDVEYEFRNDFFAKLQKLDSTFFDGNNTGDLMSRATNDMDALRMLIGPGVMYSANTLMSLPMRLIWMFALDWKLTVVSIIPLLALPPLVRHLGAKTHTLSRFQQDSFGDLTTTVQENLSGIRVVKAYRQENYEESKFLDRNDDYIKRSLDLALVQSVFFPIIRLVVGVGYALLLTYGGIQVIHNQLEVGTLLSFFILFSMLVWPLIAAGWVVNLIQRGIASLDRIRAIMEWKPTVIDASAIPVSEIPKSLAIDIRDLTFQYEGTTQPQLSNISLQIPEGHTLGIIGPVGSGKSTLVHLLGRLYPVSRGMIFIGGRDINDWPIDDIRKCISFVFQETFLFSDTIEWNIRFGANPDTPDEKMLDAARRAQVAADIELFPQKYQTVLGERGVNLSGGQKQRVSIARAIARDSRILVLDDSLSAVDTHTEEAILRDLRDIMKGRTTFLISHRISTVSLADEIIVLKEGCIAQRGTHEELVSSPGLYRELYRRQQTEAEIERLDATLGEVAPA
ncbi:MAG: ABC transporter ATP-binding protein [Candidatus Sumerlaeota bacterium]